MVAKKLKYGFLLAFLFALLITDSVLAAEKNYTVFINGIEADFYAQENENNADNNVSGEASAQSGGLTSGENIYVPFALFAEKTGMAVSYNGVSKTAKAVSGKLSIEAKANELVKINGAEAKTGNAAYISKSGKMMVSLADIGEALKTGYGDYKIAFTPSETYSEDYPVPDKEKYQEGVRAGVFEIFTACPVEFNNKMGKIASKVYHFRAEAPDGFHYAEYDVCIPFFSGLKTSEAADNLNKNFENDYEAVDKFMRQDAEAQKAAKNEGEIYTSFENRSFRVVGQYNNIVSILYMGYSYAGGAHGMPILNGVNINLENPYILQLKELFKLNSNYETLLIEKINNDIKNNIESYQVNEAEKLPAGNSFFIQNGILFIYYDPYDLAAFAYGFPSFEFSLKDLEKILKDEFKEL
ncbi:MAG: DUF4163 domain-containing protein [Clostridiales bacterium]|nr:DUF4163 domain-containing protein [Clostridiales bacterium]